MCDKTGFRFEIKLKQQTSSAWPDERIIRKFKLSKPLTENLTVINHEGKLRDYKDERLLIKDFCDYRIGILSKRIAKRKAEIESEIGWLQVKMEFIQAVLDDKIIFKNRKKADVGKQILEHTNALKDDVDRLLRINIISLTDEMVKELDKEIKAAIKDFKYWEKTTANEQFILDLDAVCE